MIIKDVGSRELIQRMRKDVEKMKTTLTKTHQKLVMTMFRDLVSHTPQWSGELAVHWGIEVHGKKAPAAYSVRNPGWASQEKKTLNMQDPYRMGSDPAVTRTIAREMRKIKEIRYNSIVKFVNNMPYAEAVERGEGPGGRPIREVNRLEAYGGVAMIGYLDAKYSKIKTVKRAAGL